jgi:hypothetical protein
VAEDELGGFDTELLPDKGLSAMIDVRRGYFRGDPRLTVVQIDVALAA